MNYRRNPGFDLNPINTIIVICILVTLAGTIIPNTYYVLGLTPAVIAQQPWTFITNIFLHARLWPSFYHLLFNMWMLYIFSAHLESFIGERKMLAVFFGGALLGNAFVLLIALLPTVNPWTITFGASGGVFAILSALAVLTPKTRVLIFGIVPAPLWAAVVGSFVILSFLPGVSWEGHLGGLLLGAVSGYYFKRRLRRDYWW